MNEDNSVAFYCNVNGTRPLSFSWYKDNSLLNIKEAMLIKNNLKRDDAGGYYCVVSNSNGSSASAVKTLKVQCKRDSLVILIDSSVVFVLVCDLNKYVCLFLLTQNEVSPNSYRLNWPIFTLFSLIMRNEISSRFNELNFHLALKISI